MPGTPVQLGPFTEGMNNEDEETTIGDNQLADVVNFELDNDGSLYSRPAFVLDADTPVAGEFADLLGYYVRNDGATFGVYVTNVKTWLYDVELKTWSEIWANRASGFAQYDNKVVLASTSVAGGYWEAGVFTSTPTMPLAADIVFYQERFWAFGAQGTANQTRVWFSNVTSLGVPPTSIWDWTVATDYFEVNKGDGQWVTGLLADTNALVIFRNRSTWRLSFSGAPLKTGTLTALNRTIGADNNVSFVAYESYYLVLNQGSLYQFINWQFYPLNTKRVRFQVGASDASLRRSTALSIFNHRAIVWYYGSTYVYSLNTNTWSRWESVVLAPYRVVTIPSASFAGDVRAALASGGLTTSPKGTYRIRDEMLAGTVGEQMTCSIRTKSYSFNEAAQHKRLFYWTFEVRSAIGATGWAVPSVIPEGGNVTTDDMDLVTTDVLDAGSVDNPLIIVPTFESEVTFPTQSPTRALIKAGQDNRFLRIRFEIFLECDGTSRTSAARIYSITPYLRIAGGVSKQVS